MRRFLMQEHKLARSAAVTVTATTTGTATDTVYVDAEGFENICVLSRVVSASGTPAITLSLMAATASGGGEETPVAAATVNWASATAGDIGALQGPTNIETPDFHYFAIKVAVTGSSGNAVVRNLYFLGGARHLPIVTTTDTANVDASHHITTVHATAVAT